MLTIEQMQEAITRLGWQYTEHVYNDGKPGKCSICLTKNKSPLALGEFRFDEKSWPNERPKTIGWGRYSREHCWQEAYQTIVIEKKYGDEVM